LGPNRVLRRIFGAKQGAEEAIWDLKGFQGRYLEPNSLLKRVCGA